MANDTYERIDKILTRHERRIANIFRTSILGLRDDLDLKTIERLLERGDIEGALDLIMDTARKLGSASSVAFIDSGEDTAKFLANAGVATISFDQVNSRAVQIMRENQLRLIREFRDSQREAIRVVMTDGVARGLAPVEQARRFRETIGLTQRQTAAVLNYRRLLEQAGNTELSIADQKESLTRALRDKRGDRSVLAAIRRGKPLKAAQITWMVGRYHERSVKYRAEVIARTEALRAAHQGLAPAFAQAIEEGKLIATDIEQQWHSARDGRVRDSHRKLNKTKKKLGEYWQGLHGQLRYPGDPSAPAAETIQCRCIVTRRIKRPKSQPGATK